MLADSLSQSQIWGVMGGLREMLRVSAPDSRLRLSTSSGYGRRRCKECEGICELLRWGEVQWRRHGDCYSGSSEPRVLHNSYRELDRSASLSACDTCRLLRRAFLLEQITGQGAELLDLAGSQGPIHAVLDISSREVARLRLSIQTPETIHPFPATIRVSGQPQQTSPDRTRGLPSLRSDLTELRRVIDGCNDSHRCRSNYRWSGRNPTWLLKILPDDCVQLIEGPRAPVDYVVLSYSWGDKESMSPPEWARIKAAGTKTIQGVPVPERLHPFKVWELPETMQDAVAIAASLGFFYIWIDSVCIPKGTNWDTEASLMHEVYGNAIFTLVASSSGKATDHLLHDRLAWAHRSRPCKLRDCWWLYHEQLPLDRVRFESPVAQRGWTLQEERLSPRILYWTGQRWYWSCAERQVAEPVHPECHAEPPAAATNEAPPSSPQRFLKLCHTGNIQQLHEEWLDIVEAYTCRDLVEPRDRFLAIAGLAVRFYTAISGSGETAATGDYLAGLWKDDLARHLGWSVASAVNPRQHLQRVAPSWSWASLPLRVHTKTKQPFTPSAHFEFIAVRPAGAARVVPLATDPGGEASSGTGAGPIERGRAVEEQGRTVKVIKVRGRFRRLVPDNSREVSWDAIQWRGGGKPRFDFTSFPGQSLYSRNKTDGRILSKNAHHGEVVGQLDYLVDTDAVESGGHPNVCCVQEGTEREIVCLELGELTMLLLVPDRNPGQPETYRRVGVAIGYGDIMGFFNGCETRTVCLA
ncbi:heterokaryon incompatibility protein-domain-containing protein [Staphylotrichum tortipilum]|uniref:Heterokaryon incompatibility protein-domain-containing protein n=1 Tax=Staphylotrichum tortipilum TaxID=2831512 RepID=A0AAN6MCZ8_9PEZI|nr:heterokaryon incompatibility protein-domain-containing protein [Staphylotrichum longicolle]